MGRKQTFPDWWDWELFFGVHADLRMEQRGVTELDVRAMLEKASGIEPSAVPGRFRVHVRHNQRPWIVIVEPILRLEFLAVVTVYEVTQ